MINRLVAGISYQIYKKQLFTHTQIRQIQYGLQAFIGETIKIFFFMYAILFNRAPKIWIICNACI